MAIQALNSTGRAALRAHTVGLFVCIALAACGPADPLEPIRRQQAEGDFAGSVEPLRELLLTRPQDSEANYLYGTALVATQRPSLALWSLRQAMEDPEWREVAGLQLAHAGLATGDFNEVVAVSNRLLEETPDSTPALLMRAQALAHWRKDPDAALADAERLLENDPNLLEAYEPLILSLLALDRHDEASEALAESGRRMAVLDPPESRLAWHCSTTAIFADEGGEPERAREQWNECLEKYPSDGTVVGNALQFFDARREFDRSLEVLRAALAETPNARGYRTGVAERMRLTGKPEEAESLLREPTESDDPRLAMVAWVDLANFQHSMGDPAAAADSFERAVALADAPNAQLLFDYADTLVLADELPRALEVADDIGVPSQRALIRARVAQAQNDHAEALAEFDEALRLWPNNPWARYYAARSAEKLGDFERALEEYRYAIRIQVSATDARTRAARLLIAQKQYSVAYSVLFFQNAEAPLEPAGQMLSMYLVARTANPSQLHTALEQQGLAHPETYPLALVHAAEGSNERAGPGAAMRLLRSAPGIRLTDPRHAVVLRAFVRFSHAFGEPERARSALASALEAHPDEAVLHEILGMDRELSGAPAKETHAAYSRALELGSGSPAVLSGLGRLALASNPAEAIELFDRAAAADPSDPAPKLAAARGLLESGNTQQAEQRLISVLEAHPFEAAAAVALVSLDLEADSVSTRTLEQAKRAAHLGGGPEAYEQLSLIYARLDEPAQAAEAAQQAQLLREHQQSIQPVEPAQPTEPPQG